MLIVLLQEIVQLKTQLQSAAEEKQSALLEMKNIHQRNDEVKRESLQLRDLNEQYLNQIGTVWHYYFIILCIFMKFIFDSIPYS